MLPTYDASGFLAAPDATPTITVYADGVLDATVATTITVVATGKYKVTVEIPAAYADGTAVAVWAAAAFAGDAAEAVLAEFPVGDTAVADMVVESGVTPSNRLVTDSGVQLDRITLKQALAAMLAALAGKGAGLETSAPTYYPAAKPGASPRLAVAAADGVGNRPTVTIRVPD
jgi:hypothetical protein